MVVDTIRLPDGTTRKLMDWTEVSLPPVSFVRGTLDRGSDRCAFCGRRPRLGELWPGTAMVYRMCVDQPGCHGFRLVREGLLQHGLLLEPERGVNMPVLKREDGSLLWRPPLSPPGSRNHTGPSWWAEPHMAHPVCVVIDKIMDARKYTGELIRVPSEPWCAWCGWIIKGAPSPARDGLIYCEVCAAGLTAYHDAHALWIREFDKEVEQEAAAPQPSQRARPYLLAGDVHGPRL